MGDDVTRLQLLLKSLTVEFWNAYNAKCTPCLKKTAKMFSSQVRQTSTKFDNFWHTNSTKDTFIWMAL